MLESVCIILSFQCAGQAHYVLNVSEHCVELVESPEDPNITAKTKYRALRGADKGQFSTTLWDTLESEKNDHKEQKVEL